MIIGGAQENTLLCCQDLAQHFGDDVLLITGPSLGPEGDLLAKSRGPEVPVARVPSLRRAIHPWRDIRAYLAIRRLLREFEPQVVHTHSAKGGMLGRVAATELNVPAVIHTVHGAPFHAYQSRGARRLFRWCERYAAKRCHALVSVADAMTDQLVGAGVAKRAKFDTVYSGMDVDPFLQSGDYREETRQRLVFNDDHIVVGKIARLFHLKGHEYLIRAAEVVIRECPQVRFLLVGDGILRDSLGQQIARAGLSDHFHFVGLVDPEQIPRYMAAMDELVHVSLREGLAPTLPQALIAGKPVVSYDVDGAREVVIPGETGFLVPPKSTSPLAEALARLSQDGGLRRDMGLQGRRRFTDQFRHERMTDQLRKIYARILDSRSHGTSGAGC